MLNQIEKRGREMIKLTKTDVKKGYNDDLLILVLKGVQICKLCF